MSWLWGSSTNPQYEELVEQACSPMKLPYPQGEDMSLNLEITDMIRSKAVQPKPAMQALKLRVAGKNARVQMYALSLIDTCIKNGGDHFLAEIASKEFVDEMSTQILSHNTNPEAKAMALRMFQAWALAFQSRRDLAFLVDVYHELKNSGIKFPPPMSETSAHMLDTSTAPTWVDSDVCMRCRTAFTFTNRKHHCRNCGLVFDQACSSRVMPLPNFGIKEEVRVCEGCWIKAGKNKPAPAIPGRTRRSRADYDADLQRAIELSLTQGHPGAAPSEPPLAIKNGSSLDDDDEQLRLAIEASLRDMERARPSAPTEEGVEYKPLPTFDLSARETETILTFSNTLDQMAAYGERDLRRFPQAHILAEQAYQIGPKLHRNAEEKSTKQQMLAEMQAKLTQAVAMYGSILDGQQAYSQRKAQEAALAAQQQAQQRQYSYPYGFQPYQQQQYGQPQQYAGVNGQPQQYAANGYAPYAAPPQAAPVSPQHTAAAAPQAPSMYPTMPAYAYQQPYQQPQQWVQAPQYAPQWSQPAQSQPSTSRQASYAAPVSPEQQPAPAPALPANTTGTYTAEPQGYDIPQQPAQQPSAPQQVPSAPPPVDLASHPSLSPRSSTVSMPLAPSAPARSASYTSPVVGTAPLAASPVAQHTSIPSAPPAQAPQQQQPPQQQRTDSTHVPVSAPPAANANPWAEFEVAAAQPQQQVGYTASMFPAAPDGFSEPQGHAQPAVQREEMLIEL